MQRFRASLASAAYHTRAGFFSLNDSPSRILTLYLSEEFRFTDLTAGTVFGLWGTLLTLYGLFLGAVIDALGTKRSLMICFGLNIASRLVMATTASKTVMLCTLLGPNTIAGALGVPVMTIAVKRYTTNRNRGFAFSLFYTLMNVAALSQGLIVDIFRITFRDGFNIDWLSKHHFLNNGTRLFVLSGFLTSTAGLITTSFLSVKKLDQRHHWHGDDMHHRGDDDSGVDDSPSYHHESQPMDTNEEATLPLIDESEPLRIKNVESIRSDLYLSISSIVKSAEFLKFTCMCVIMTNVKSLFRHLDATLPKYQIRAFGRDCPVGAIYSLNPAIIVLLVPVIGAVTTHFAHFDMIHFGAWLSSLSPLWMVGFSTVWSTVAFVVFLSLGEAVWSPRWFDYAMSIAPNGKEGVFTALTSAPLFLAMLPTGMISGALLQHYCPSSSTCEGRPLWLIIFSIAFFSPLCIALTRQWIRPRPDAIVLADDEHGGDAILSNASSF